MSGFDIDIEVTILDSGKVTLSPLIINSGTYNKGGDYTIGITNGSSINTIPTGFKGKYMTDDYEITFSTEGEIPPGEIGQGVISIDGVLLPTPEHIIQFSILTNDT